MSSIQNNEDSSDDPRSLLVSYQNDERSAAAAAGAKKRGRSYLDGDGHQMCPTCKGTGKVDRDEQNKLVALIPLSDSRLKPKRIWLWILGTFVVCLIVASFVTFIMAPRSVEITNNLTNLRPYNMSYITDHNSTIIGMILYFDETYSIDNKNYYEIKITEVLLQLNRNSHIVQPQIEYDKDTVVAGRSRLDFVVKVRYIFYILNDPYASLCIRGVINELFSLISTSFSFATLWTKSQQLDMSNVQYLYCANQTNSTLSNL